MIDKPSPHNEDGFLVDWPLTREAAGAQLRRAKVELDRFRAALRLANQEIERRNKIIKASTAFSYQAGRAASASELLQLALTRALEVTENQIGIVVLIDQKTKMLRVGSHKNLPPALGLILTGRHYDPSTTALMPHLVAGHGVLLEHTDTADEAEKQLLGRCNLNSLVSLPLYVGQQLLGALVLATQGEKIFSPAKLHFLILVAQETASALQALRIQDRLWHLAETLLTDEATADSNVSEALTLELTPSPPSRSPLQEKLAQIVNNVGGSMGALYVIDSSEGGMSVTLMADYGLSPAFTGAFSYFSLSEGLLPVDLLSKRRLIIPNMQKLAANTLFPLLAGFQQEGSASLLAGQINNPGQKLWFVFVAATKANKLNAHQLKHILLAAKTLPTLAEKKPSPQVKTPIKIPPSPLAPKERADDLEKLLAAMMDAEEEVQRQNTDMATLNAIAEMISRTMNLDNILEQVVSQIQSVLETDALWLYLVEDPLGNVRKQGLSLKIHKGLSKRYIRGMRNMAYGKPLEGLVAKENRAKFIQNINEYEIRCHLLVEQEGFRALAIVPLSSPEEHDGEERSRIIGVLGIGLYQIHVWQAREIRVLTAIANQVALGINNAQLYTKVKEDMTMLATSNDVLQTMNEHLLNEQALLEDQLAVLRRRYR